MNWSLIGGWLLGVATSYGFFLIWQSSHCSSLLGALVCRP